MKTVLITGASRGIGAETAKVFAENGYGVAVNYLSSEERALSLCGEINGAGGAAFPVRGDVSVKAEADRIVEAVRSELGHIDVLVNNAGIAQIKLFTDVTEREWDRLMDVNVKSVYNCTSAVLPEMIRRKSGCIVNVSSIWGVSGASCEVAYSASKAAVIGFTKALAKETAMSGIRVNCVAPGAIDTDMNRSFSDEERRGIEEVIPMGRFGSPRETAELIYFLASDKAGFITGQVINQNGGMI